MNGTISRWWVALALLILALGLALAATQAEFAQAAAGFLALFLLAVALIALLLVMAALWPGFTQRARANLEDAPGKTFLIGLINYLFLGAIALVLMNLGPLAVGGLALGGILLLGTLLGLPAAAGLVGGRLYRLREQEAAPPWDEVVAGGVALYLTSLLPAAGWFLVMPALCLWSFGAAALTLTSRRKDEEVAQV